MILRREPALARANDCEARIWLTLTKEFATGNRTVTAANQDDGAHVVDIERTCAPDILSTRAELGEV
jgi:hypothetical protein